MLNFLKAKNNIFYSDWSSEFVCNDCECVLSSGIGFFVCPKCGGSTSSKTLRKKYKRIFFIFRKLISVEMKYANKNE